ncbi:cytochrome c [Desulfolithobacter dissulfuricans]|uniref:Cytochrome c n=1 Tax=Desulfolithobacter dissulfuricans TaxID=2795293 RepID=A0A915U3S7_9BACT|nr:sulfate reduction electron transfer complex DsrMKJOP subunit DsrJ [Desulfolithobacter dissulfuricans]BCO10320.1 cytochrome c [Desulfolithobacter dissulfuricans]
MYDSGKIIPGLIIFVLFITFPIWYNHGDAGAVPKPELPKDAKECVRPADFMRAEHMQLLNEWRDEVLRTGDRSFNVKIGDRQYQKSLMNTCMQCHTSKKKFCDTCHTYASVTPYCWDCHLAPVE